ncbi:HNH endonuclease [Streptomyces erythrochromogenes]|uniref:HNH endonuclease n=1 Tax=Streptomyces erythrochromogenes TaxID=285574 RepID=UPI0036BAB96C
MARRNDRPQNPEYLLRAVRRIFGEACLLCGISSPRAEMAHVRDWPTVRAEGHAPFERLLTSTVGAQRTSKTQPTKPADVDKIADQHTYSLFHDLGNVLPLCPNCHTLYDGKDYPEVTEKEVLAARNSAVRQPEVLTQAIRFIEDELRGRPRRCTHLDKDGRREHTYRSDVMALSAPLSWVASGFAAGLDLGDPMLVVECASRLEHHHVDLAHTTVDLCIGPIRACPDLGRHPVADGGAR